jgi:hypothetical protein
MSKHRVVIEFGVPHPMTKAELKRHFRDIFSISGLIEIKVKRIKDLDKPTKKEPTNEHA